MLDPFYRTVRGFAILVEKDWVHMGHMWSWRHGQTQGDDPKAKERAPIFLQFLCCVAQLLQQYPTAFEFASPMLVWLHRASVSGTYGTFLANDPRERFHLSIYERTVSVWETLVNEDGAVKSEYRNALYLSCESSILWNAQFAKQTLFDQCYLWPVSVYRPSLTKEQMVSRFVSRLHLQIQELEKKCAYYADAHPELAARYAAMDQIKSEQDLSEGAEADVIETLPVEPHLMDYSSSRPLDGARNEEAWSGGRHSPPERVQSPEVWVPDTLVENCFRCNVKFTFTNRKHHCRQCLQVVCGSCSGHRLVVNGSLERVCDECFRQKFVGK